MKRPRIGITVPRQQSAAYRDYLQRIVECGGEPVELTPPVPASGPAAPLLAGLLLPGGGDVAPARYGAKAHPETDGIRPELDELELGLVRHARESGIPILAICRGHQLLNVALGGALHQHIDGDGHRARADERYPSRWHEVRIEPGSRLAQLLGAGEQLVNSRHHQAVRPEIMAPELRAVARSRDGFVEAMESRDGAWVVSVQWHPERDEMRLRSRPLFEDLIRAATRRNMIASY